VWPSNKDIPLIVGVPVIMNHRVHTGEYFTREKTGCESEFSVDKVGDGGTEVASHTALAFQTDPAIK